MCILCDALKDERKEIRWNVRSRYSDDNICEFVNDVQCENCKDCNSCFKLSHYNYDGCIHVSVEFNKTITTNDGEDVIIKPFSESIPFNFCPICGEKLTQNNIELDKLKYLSNYLEIEDRKDIKEE